MARPYVTGPAHLYVGIYRDPTFSEVFVRRTVTRGPFLVAGKAIPVQPGPVLSTEPPTPNPVAYFLYLGTAEIAPVIELCPAWTPHYTSRFGPKVPQDLRFDGEWAMVLADLTRWNEKTYKIITTKGSSQTAYEGGISRGTIKPTDLGRLAFAENTASHCLWVVFPYSQKGYVQDQAHPGPVDPSFPPGYRFPLSALFDPDKLAERGPRAGHLVLSWHAHYFPNQAQDGSTQLTLYDHDISNLPNPD